MGKYFWWVGVCELFNDAPLLIIKEKMAKTEVSLIGHSTPLKQ